MVAGGSGVGRRIATGLSLVFLVWALLELDQLAPSGVVPWGVGAAIAGLGAWELVRMEGLRSWRLSPALPAAAAAVALVAWFGREALWTPRHPYLPLLANAAVATVVVLVLGSGRRLPAVGLALWCTVPPVGLLAMHDAWGTRGLACLVILSKIGDVLGYFVGRAMGKSHPFPRLSPGKTTAGCVASLVGGVAAGALLGLGHALPGNPGAWGGALAGLLLNVAAQAGDLLESHVKRRAGVKDSSSLVAAAGGVLDVVDSVLLTIPVALIVWPVLLGV